MSSRSIECQIARGQISRYLGGDAFSPEALGQLEAHVSNCSDCKDHLNERKNALQSMLGKPQLPAEPQHVPAPEVRSTSSASQPTPPQTLANPFGVQAILGLFGLKMVPKQPAQPTPTVPSPKVTTSQTALTQPVAWKPIAYSLALALVLGAMSLASKNMDRVFGPKAGSLVASKEGDAASTSDTSSKPKKSTKRHAELKPLKPIADDQDDAAKAARAARNAVLARKAKAKLSRSSESAAQSLPSKSQSDPYQAEPAPKLTVPGHEAPKKVAKVPSMLRKAPPGAPMVKKLAKRGLTVSGRATSKPKKPRLLQVESRPERHIRLQPVRVKHHTAKKKAHHAKPVSQGIHVYAPDPQP